MATVKFLPYAPDLSDLNGGYTARLRNVIPRADGYGPFSDLVAFTSALPGVCRGYFFARNLDSSVTLFAATATRLYVLNNTNLSWTDVSKGATDYATIANDAQWSFAQFGSIVVATQKNIVMQSYNLTSSTAFADLGGSPPQAGYICVLGGFLVASDLLSFPYRIQWCGLYQLTTWTPTVSLSDFQDFQDGGRVRCVEEIQANVGLICQDGMLRRMTFAPGSAEIFQIDKLHQDRGILAPYSLCVGAGVAYLLSTRGFISIAADGSISQIGEETVDRTFLGLHEASVPSAILNLAYDAGSPQLVLGACDPERNLALFVYKSQAGQAGLFDRGLLFHTTLKRWAPFELTGEFMEPVAKPGLTLESLDAIAPGAQTVTGAANNGSGLIRLTVGSTSGWTTGDYKTVESVGGTTEANGLWAITVVDTTHIDLQGSAFVNAYTSGGLVAGEVDLLAFSLDDINTSTLPAFSAFNFNHQLGLFTGSSLQAEIYTQTQSAGRNRMNVESAVPMTDAQNAYCSLIKLENLNSDETIGVESLQDSDGVCWLDDETRFARIKLRIPYGEIWSFASGVDINASNAGLY